MGIHQRGNPDAALRSLHQVIVEHIRMPSPTSIAWAELWPVVMQLFWECSALFSFEHFNLNTQQIMLESNVVKRTLRMPDHGTLKNSAFLFETLFQHCLTVFQLTKTTSSLFLNGCMECATCYLMSYKGSLRYGHSAYYIVCYCSMTLTSTSYSYLLIIDTSSIQEIIKGDVCVLRFTSQVPWPCFFTTLKDFLAKNPWLRPPFSGRRCD